MQITLIATATFGLEAVVKHELEALGFSELRVNNGFVEFDADVTDIPTLNLWLRCADRILVKIGAFQADHFDALFDQTKSLPWETFITQDGQFVVTAKSVRSTLGSLRACQSIVKKAVVERLKDCYKIDWLEETGPEFKVQVSLLNDTATLTIDTTGVGLHKRGYRQSAVEAPLKETLAAALVKLSSWNDTQLLMDPMCGSGTILIEAAMIARKIAPGISRQFVSEKWPIIPDSAWTAARQKAKDSILKESALKIKGYDVSSNAIQIAKQNAEQAGVGPDIQFEAQDIQKLWIDQQYGIVISNPPYGIRISDFVEINEIYISIHKTFKKKWGWSLFILTADKKFPNYFKRARPTRVRKLYNGRIEVNYYQYLSK